MTLYASKLNTCVKGECICETMALYPVLIQPVILYPWGNTPRLQDQARVSMVSTRLKVSVIWSARQACPHMLVRRWDPAGEKTGKELVSFLGVIRYYRKFFANFAGVAKLLTDRTKREPDVFRWNHKSNEAYHELKGRLSHHTILRQPHIDKEFILTTGASQQEGKGAVLSQENDAVTKPVMYISGS